MTIVHLRILSIISKVCLVCLLVRGIAFGEPLNGITWQTLETQYTIIRFQSTEDLAKFHREIKYRDHSFSLTQLFSGSKTNDLENQLTEKIDLLFERVESILDMKKKMKKISINIYHEEKQLKDAYQDIYGQPCHIRAWYEFRYNTIYINVKDVHEGMLAHEMAHGIIDHFLLVRPPAATAEILARYVDSHLKE